MTRTCSECQLCCKLLPVQDNSPIRGVFRKSANTRCQHQRHGKGCAIYPTKPHSCSMFSCGWLVDPATADLSRPDRSHYVIDPAVDFIVTVDHETGEETKVVCAQIWCDPGFPDAHRDPHLRAYLRAKNAPAIVRYGSKAGVFIAPRSDGTWFEAISYMKSRPQHTPEEILAAVEEAGMKMDE